MPMNVEPLVFEGEAVRLEPLTLDHVPALHAAAHDPDTFLYFSADPSGSLDKMRAWVSAALAARDEGTAQPFAVIALPSGKVVGSTRYFDISGPDRHLEIGHTWIAAEVRRTRINTEMKYLLLRHAFETLGAIRVQLKTDRRNERSQRAIERIGGVREGILRKHMILESGYIRDTVMYSITDEEWPAVKAMLEAKLAA
jgi:RimJ/RimL family protein N-acetyltransferase